MAARSRKPVNEPDDPHGLIGQVLAMGADFPGPAGDILLSWLLDLKDRTERSKAAANLIERHGLAGRPFPPGPLGELIRLLHQAARHSPDRPQYRALRRR